MTKGGGRFAIRAVLAVISLLGVFAACDKDRPPAADAGSPEPPAPGDSSLPITTEPLEILVWKQDHDDISYRGDMEIWREVARRTNVHVRFRTVPAGTSEDLSQAFVLAMALGPDCDAYVASRSDINAYGENGVFLRLDELVRSHAPTVAEHLLDDPYNRALAVSNSAKLYAVSMMAAIRAKAGFFIRADWLDRLGLEAPETPDDWVRVLRAFRDGDANRNGRADELPFWTRIGLDGLWAFGSAFNAETTEENPWVVREGKVVFGAMEPQFKELVEFLRLLYAEGLLDSHYLTRPTDFRNEALRRDIGGATHDWIGSTLTRAMKYRKQVDGLELLAVPPPSIPGRSVPYTRVQMDPVRNVAWGIPAQSRHLIETIRLMEFVFSDEGMRLFNFGIEGRHHVVRNGTYEYTDSITSDPAGVAHALLTIGSGNFPYRQHIDYETQYASLPSIVEARAMYEGLIRPSFPPLQLGESGKMLSDLLRVAIDYRNETVNKLIHGIVPMREYEGFTRQLEERGVGELQRVYQRAYNRYIGSGS